MPYKLCPNCNQSSYSACDMKKWKCPNCGKDITFVRSTIEKLEPVIISKQNREFPSYLRLVQ